MSGAPGFAVSLAAGALVALPVLALGEPIATLAGHFPGRFGEAFFRAFVNAALPEELFKLVALLLVLRSSPGRRAIRRGAVPTMAIGAGVGLGFALIETVIYALRVGPHVGLMRIFTAIPCHLFLGALMAHYLWAAHETKSAVARLKAFFVPVLAHGLYNFPLLVELARTAQRPVGAMLLTWMVLFLLAGWTRFLLVRYRLPPA